MFGMEARVELLDSDSAEFNVIVDWHWQQWNRHHDDADLEALRARLRGRTNHDAIPFTLVAWIEREAVGCLSVCQDDVDGRFSDRGPWLSGMFVVGRARNLGVGRALVKAGEARARSYGASELWLHTGEAGRFYERCGWSLVQRKLRLIDDAVMYRTL